METQEPSTPSNSRSKLAIGIVAGLLIVALVAAGVIFIPRLLSPASALNATAAAIPANTQIYFSFNPHYENLPNGDVVKKAWDEDVLATLFEDNFAKTLEQANLNWEQDIASWLGDEVGFGIADLSFDQSGFSEPPTFVVAAATRDKAKSDAFLAKLRADAESNGIEFTEQSYRDVATVEQTGGDGEHALAYATVEDMVLIASGSGALHGAIDAALDGSGLDKSANFQAAVSKLRGGRAMTGYVEMASILNMLVEQVQQSGEMSGAFDQQMLDALTAVQGQALGLSFEPNGMLLEFVATVDLDQVSAENLATLTAPGAANTLLRAVPDTAFAYLGGEMRPETFEAMFETPTMQEALDALEMETGINLQEDVLSWLNGEIALTVLPGVLSGGSSLPVGVAFLVQPEDKELAATQLDALMQKIAEEGSTEVVEVTVGDSSMNALTDDSGEPMVVYGPIGENLVIAVPENAAEKIANAGDRPLADAETFKAAVAPLPASNNGYQYIQPKPIADLVALGLAFSGGECPACDLFQPVLGIAFAAEQPQAETGVGRGALFILLDVEE
jgi:hypothetical protein